MLPTNNLNPEILKSCKSWFRQRKRRAYKVRLPENEGKKLRFVPATLIRFCARASAASARGRFRSGHLRRVVLWHVQVHFRHVLRQYPMPTLLFQPMR